MNYLDKVNSPEDIKSFTIKELNFLSNDIRNFLINNISKTGGHLSSNLGVVELTVALHYCFNSPKDKIIWDVGHQSYVHKIITGRKNKFNTLRKLNGISGFPKPSESVHDNFNTGHSSTSISLGLGLAISRDLKKEDYKVISIVGDGSMTGGLSYEGLNNTGRSSTDFIVILNDNNMSISENVGAISKYLNDIRISSSYIEAKNDINKIIKKIPLIGINISKFLEKLKFGFKSMFISNSIFENMGFKYFGPIDGHNINELVSTFNSIKKIKGPILLHVYTKKGKGYSPAEKNPILYHGVDTFDPKTGNFIKKTKPITYSNIFVETLISLSKNNENILAITASMLEGTDLIKFKKIFPNRIFDVGISEAHAVTFASSLAKNNFVPIFAVYSTFLQRAYDQIVHDVCIENLHVIFAIDRAGIVGQDGETHQGLFDISYLTHIPNIVIMAPKNSLEFKYMIKFAIEYNGPIAIRYPKCSASLVLEEKTKEIQLGKSEIIFKGKDIILLSFGNMMNYVYEIYKKLKLNCFFPTLINIRFAKPLDLEMIKSLNFYKYIFIFEDNIKNGGIASNILNKILDLDINFNIKNVFSFSFPDKFIEQGKNEELYKIYKLDVESMYNKILMIITQ